MQALAFWSALLKHDTLQSLPIQVQVCTVLSVPKRLLSPEAGSHQEVSSSTVDQDVEAA